MFLFIYFYLWGFLIVNGGPGLSLSNKKKIRLRLRAQTSKHMYATSRAAAFYLLMSKMAPASFESKTQRQSATE